MTRLCLKTTLSGFMAAALFWAAPIVQAYVLPGPYLVSMLARTMGTADTLLVNQRQVLFGLSENGQAQEITETLRYRFPLSLRSDVTTTVARRIFIQQGGRTITVLDGKVIPEADNRLDLYRDLLLARSHTPLRNRLLAAGVDVALSSMGHDESAVVYVLGASFPDTTLPQLWIDKERFLPVRWILYPSGAGSSATQQIEFRFQEWERLEGGLWYPRRVECYQNQILVRQITVISTRVNVSFKDALFSLEAFSSAASRPEESPAPPEGSPEMEEVQKTIEDFKKIYQ